MYQAIYSGDVFDRLPASRIGAWAETVERWHSEGLPRDTDPNDVVGLVSDDAVALDVNLNMYPMYDIKVLETDGDHVTLIDEYGVTKKMIRADFNRSGGKMSAAGTTSGMSHWLQFPVSDMYSWKAVFEQRFNAERDGRIGYQTAKDIADVKNLVETRWVRHFSFPFGGFFSATRQLMGLEGMIYAMNDDPDLIHAIVSDLSLFYADTMALIVPEVRLDMIMCFEDMCSNRAPLISPAMFNEFFAPGYKKYFGALRELGVQHFFIDTDGDSRLIIPALLECGFTGLHPCEAKAGMNPAPLLETYPQLSCNGGIDKMAVAIGGDALEREMKEKFATAWEFGRYTPGLDHGFPPDISWNNAQEYARLFLELSNQS